MSGVQQAAIRDLIERWNDGEREVDEDLTDPDAEVHSAMTGFTYRGFAGIREWMSEIDEQFDSWRVTVEQMEDVGDDQVVAIGSVNFRGRGSGVEFDQPLAWTFRFKEERIVEVRIFGESEAARAAAATA